MTTTNQTRFDLKTQSGRDRFRDLLLSTLSEETKVHLQAALEREETEIDADKAEVRRREEEERKHRDHLRRVKDLERDNDRRNSGG